MTSLAATESSCPEPSDFLLSVRALCAEDAEDYFLNFWLARSVDRSKLDEIERREFDDACALYVRSCSSVGPHPASVEVGGMQTGYH